MVNGEFQQRDESYFFKESDEKVKYIKYNIRDEEFFRQACQQSGHSRRKKNEPEDRSMETIHTNIK